MAAKGGIPGKALGPHTSKKLVPIEVGRLTKPGMYPDGKGLYFRIAKTGAKSWIFRFRAGGKRRDMGLGTYPDISLSEARKRAEDCRKHLYFGRDPLDAKNAERTAQRQVEEARRIAEARKTTFRECTKAYASSHGRAWSNAKHATQWLTTLETYAYPVFGDLPVEAIDTALVMKALEPIWNDISITASRVRGRIERVLDYAKAQGLRSAENPARWRGHLDNLLPKHSKARNVEHLPALPYAQLGSFMDGLRSREGNPERALEFLILTAVRTSGVIGATWDEFDLNQKLWTIPAGRMKARTLHRVPLSRAALAVLEAMKAAREGEYVFSGFKAGKSLSHMAMLKLLERMGLPGLTVHGFRSTFRDWAAEQTSFPREVAEAALAHTNKNKVEASYLRSDFLERRRQLMDAWADFAYRLPGENVIAARFGGVA